MIKCIEFEYSETDRYSYSFIGFLPLSSGGVAFLFMMLFLPLSDAEVRVSTNRKLRLYEDGS
jgi:uncharacterized ion transporter superfamily protein YfcC